MNFIDKAISFISPRLGYQRQAWRDATTRSFYDSAGNDRRNSSWQTFNATAEQTDQLARDTIRARARDLERNSDVAESIINAYERNVVGKGFKLQSKIVKNDIEVETLNREIEELFNEWCKPKNCDITGQQSFKELCTMAVRRMRVDGGIIFIRNYTSSGIIPYQLQARDIDELDTNGTWRNNQNGNRIVSGIEIDDNNKPVAYYLKEITIDGFYEGKSTRIEADRVLFLYKKTRPSQIREISMMSRTIGRVRDINEFVEAVSVKERVTACLSAFITKNDPGYGGGLGRRGKDSSSGYEQQTLTPGMIMELQPGEGVTTVNPTSSSASAKDFIMTQMRLAASGQGLSYESASRDMSQVNYSSARQGLLEDKKSYQDVQEFFIDHFLDEVYEDFFNAAILSGKIKIEDYSTNKRHYLKHSWICSGWEWIDPLKEVKANEAAIDANIDTLEKICAEKGEYWRDVLEQRAKEKEYEKKLNGGLEENEEVEK